MTTPHRLRNLLLSFSLTLPLSAGACGDATDATPDGGRPDAAVQDVAADTTASTPPDGQDGDGAAPDGAPGADTTVSDIVRDVAPQPDGGDGPDVQDGVSSDDAAQDTTPVEDLVEDVPSPRDTNGVEDTAEVAGGDGGDDAGPADTADAGADTAADTAPDPCDAPGLEDTDGDGTPDLCDPCPSVPRILLYTFASDHDLATRALDHLGCPYTATDLTDYVQLLYSGDFGLTVIDAPDARPSGEFARALLDFVVGGGAAILSSWRLDLIPGPSVPATFGAMISSDLQDPIAFTPTWIHPLYTTPARTVPRPGLHTFAPRADSPYGTNGHTLVAVGGTVHARTAAGLPLIVQSNGGRTFLNGFLFDDFPADTDGDGLPDMSALIVNQLHAAAVARLPAPDVDAPTVSNVPGVHEGTATLRLDLPLLRGFADRSAARLTLRRGDEAVDAAVVDGRFKILAPLAPGDNFLTLSAAGRDALVRVRYTPQTNPHKVRMVYIVASDSDGSFQAPPGVPNDLASARRRLALTGRLLQSAYADRMNEAGAGHRTFNLQRDGSGAVEVIVWNSGRTTAEWFAYGDAVAGGHGLWQEVSSRLGELPACGECTTIAMLGMSRFEDGRAKAHTALGLLMGRNGLGLFGTANLHAFPERVQDVEAHFLDPRLISDLGTPLFDDSGLRGAMWANFSTGLGAILHEVGHAFGLPHPTEYAHLMRRGFDQTNRIFMLTEPPSATTAGMSLVLPQHEPTFHLGNQRRLVYSRAFSMDARNFTVNGPPTASRNGDIWTFSSPAGVRVVGQLVNRSGDWRLITANSMDSAMAPTQTTVDLSLVRLIFPNEAQLQLTVTDDQGNMMTTPEFDL